jgi:hypothetical protein
MNCAGRSGHVEQGASDAMIEAGSREFLSACSVEIDTPESAAWSIFTAMVRASTTHYIRPNQDGSEVFEDSVIRKS